MAIFMNNVNPILQLYSYQDFEASEEYAPREPDFFSSPVSYFEKKFYSAFDTVEDVLYTVSDGFENIRISFYNSEESSLQ